VNEEDRKTGEMGKKGTSLQGSKRSGSHIYVGGLMGRAFRLGGGGGGGGGEVTKRKGGSGIV